MFFNKMKYLQSAVDALHEENDELKKKCNQLQAELQNKNGDITRLTWKLQSYAWHYRRQWLKISIILIFY